MSETFGSGTAQSENTPGYLILTVIFVVSFLVNVVAMEPQLGVYDEGLVLVGVLRIKAGDVPYRDFWTMYGPGQFYLLAGLFKAFGDYGIIERIWDIVVRSATVVACFYFVGQVASRTAAVLSAVGVLVLLAWPRTYGFPIYPATAFTALAVICMIKCFDRRTLVRLPFAAGICAGLAALFRHDLGLYAAVACAAGLVIGDAVLLPRPQWRTERWQLLVNLVALAAGAVCIVGPMVVFLLWTVPVADLYQNLFQIPAFIYPKVRALPFIPFWHYVQEALNGKPDYLQELSTYIPFATLPVAGVLVATSLARDPSNSMENHRTRRLVAATLFLIVLAGLFILKGIVRFSSIHMIQSIVFSIALLGMCSALPACRRPWGAAMLATMAVLITLPLGAFGYRAVVMAGTNLDNGSLIQLCRQPETARMTCLRVGAEMSAVARYIMKTTAPDERIYVAAGRHDKLFVNDLALYFVAERLPATKWHDLHPGVQTQLAIQKEMVAEFEATKPRIVVVNNLYDSVIEPNESSKSSGIVLIDQYLADHYQKELAISPFWILVRR